MAKAKQQAAQKIPPKNQMRNYISQSDIPGYDLSKALAISRAIIENYAAKPSTPLQIAKALNVSPSSGGFRLLCGASIAYGLTQGGAYADVISIEPLAKRILKPVEEGEDRRAMIEAFLKPRINRDFFQRYDGSPIPRADIAQNVLEDLGVPSDKSESILKMLIAQGEALGLITELKSKKYIEIDIAKGEYHTDSEESLDIVEADVKYQRSDNIPENIAELNSNDIQSPISNKEVDTLRMKKVFITHGKNKKFLEPLKKLLSFGELQPVISVEKTSISQPVPDKVLTEMRSCGAAIIHVEDELHLLDSNANEHIIINANVLIEIGAAMALFGRRFILLVKQGVQLPSNLQGLFEVRYAGEELDGNATIKLLEAINDIKNQKLP